MTTTRIVPRCFRLKKQILPNYRHLCHLKILVRRRSIAVRAAGWCCVPAERKLHYASPEEPQQCAEV